MLAVVFAALVGALAGDGVPAIWIALAVPVWLVLAKLYGLYDNDHRALRHLTVDELPSLIAWATTGAATHFALMSIVGQQSVAAPAAVRFWLTLLLVAPLTRASAALAPRCPSGAGDAGGIRAAGDSDASEA